MLGRPEDASVLVGSRVGESVDLTRLAANETPEVGALAVLAALVGVVALSALGLEDLGALLDVATGLDLDVGLGDHTAAEAEHKVKGGLLLDVVISEGAAVLELLAREDQALLVGGDALLVLDLGLDHVDGVRGLDLQGDWAKQRDEAHPSQCSTCCSTYASDAAMRGIIYISFGDNGIVHVAAMTWTDEASSLLGLVRPTNFGEVMGPGVGILGRLGRRGGRDATGAYWSFQ